MTEDTKVVNGMSEENAIEALKRYRDETGKSQSTIAKELGLSSGAVSSFLSLTYRKQRLRLCFLYVRLRCLLQELLSLP